ncbi:MAG TPA: hypothetical protein VES97_08560 [Solirubrobacteraceae bacterium]|nr:hypothetical protein [Solirubrobacteraceae bacterium]
MALGAPAATLALALASGGCGGLKAADLFIVSRSGSTPGARLTLLVNEEGGVHCNGGPTLKLSDPELVQARAIQEEIHDAAASHLSLPPRPGSVFSYYVRDPDGTVRFSDNSAGQPRVLGELKLFVLQTAQRVCRLAE